MRAGAAGKIKKSERQEQRIWGRLELQLSQLVKTPRGRFTVLSETLGEIIGRGQLVNFLLAQIDF